MEVESIQRDHRIPAQITAGDEDDRGVHHLNAAVAGAVRLLPPQQVHRGASGPQLSRTVWLVGERQPDRALETSRVPRYLYRLRPALAVEPDQVQRRRHLSVGAAPEHEQLAGVVDQGRAALASGVAGSRNEEPSRLALDRRDVERHHPVFRRDSVPAGGEELAVVGDLHFDQLALVPERRDRPLRRRSRRQECADEEQTAERSRRLRSHALRLSRGRTSMLINSSGT